MRKLLLLGGGALAVLLLVGLPSIAQDALDPTGELTDAECYGHHKQEGFRSMDLFPDGLQEVPKAGTFPFDLTVKNPWLADLTQVSAYVNISNAPGVYFAGARPADEKPYKGETQPATQPGGAYSSKPYPVDVVDGATEIYASMVGTPATSPLPAGTPGVYANSSDYRLVILGPDNKPASEEPAFDAKTTYDVTARTSHKLAGLAHVNATTILQRGPGKYTATVYYGGVQTGTYDLFVGAYYNASQELVLKGPELLKPGEQYTFHFTVQTKDVAALQHMRYGGRANAHHVHTDKNIESDGAYDKFSTVEFRTGAQLVKTGGDVSASGSTVSLLEPVLRRWGQVLGFASAFLIIPSLVFGGTFGRGTVTTLNKWMGTPRRRVLFHNSMSFWLLGVALLHMVLFLYEAFWVWSAGVLWGGLALAAMIGLGVTGAVQRRFVARWGFNRWRYVHFAMGILVVVFTVIHSVADGSHFAFLRDMFGPTVPK